MARNGKIYTADKKAEMIALYDDLQSYSEVARRLNVAPNTVRNAVKNKKINRKTNPLLQEIAKIKDESNKELLDHIKSAQFSNITKNIMDLLTKEALANELNKTGVRTLVYALGVSAEKVINVKKYEIQEKQLSIQEKKLELEIRQLELKEKELKARMDNPDAFSDVVIINDSETVTDWYKQNGIEKPYSQN